MMKVRFKLTFSCLVVPVPGLYNQRVCPLKEKAKTKTLDMVFMTHYFSFVQVGLNELSKCWPLTGIM